MSASLDGYGDETPVDMTEHDFPDACDDDFEEDISTEEREHYMKRFPDINSVIKYKLHCTACDRHLGCSSRVESRLKTHPMLKTLVCQPCHTFYNSGEFEKGDDGSELYCRWCGQGGQVYCCSKCPHVFCAKCVKRNFGASKIKEIEDTDDWQCFRCKPKCLWDLRAVCWAVIRFCSQRSRIVRQTSDNDLKQKWLKENLVDFSECCKGKKKKLSVGRPKLDMLKRECKEKENDTKKSDSASIITKISPQIQVKKFAMMGDEKKAQKRPGSPFLSMPKGGIMVKNIAKLPNIVPKLPQLSGPNTYPMPIKKARIQPLANQVSFVRFPSATYTPRIKPKPLIQNPYPSYAGNYNGPNNFGRVNNYVGDNINLSLESLTQGLDMAVVSAMANSNSFGAMNNDDLVCTPDFPLEPMCEVTEDNADDDVECITPGPIAAPKSNLPSLVPRGPILEKDIIQMTENDVTINKVTGGLKFRVNPQTLSSNKMYRLPDGRVFAININPNMPGGYSATIVTTADNVTSSQRGPTYAAKVSSVTVKKPAQQTPQRNKKKASKNNTPEILKNNTPEIQKEKKTKKCRVMDLDVPVEWYRFNLIETIDALEYSLDRLKNLKTNATTANLRASTIPEIKSRTKTLDTLLKNSVTRFIEIRENLSKDAKMYLIKKKKDKVTQEITVSDENDEDDDDDVEILSVNNDPIFIEEDSTDSATEPLVNPVRVDLDSSDLNESGDKYEPSSNDPLCEDKEKTDNHNEAEPMELNDTAKDTDTEIDADNNQVTICDKDAEAAPPTTEDTLDVDNNQVKDCDKDTESDPTTTDDKNSDSNKSDKEPSSPQDNATDKMETDECNEDAETRVSEKADTDDNKRNKNNDQTETGSDVNDDENNQSNELNAENKNSVDNQDSTEHGDVETNEEKKHDNKDKSATENISHEDGEKNIEDIMGAIQNMIQESNSAEAKSEDHNDSTLNGDANEEYITESSVQKTSEKRDASLESNDNGEVITGDL